VSKKIGRNVPPHGKEMSAVICRSIIQDRGHDS